MVFPIAELMFYFLRALVNILEAVLILKLINERKLVHCQGPHGGA